eukprot:CAMPEP_0178616754 /NCGR_PEP_ID=MMETSP0698-20121128/3371_1 /TAXON_ID=265572 /ORGANISM="Extubocellulus spinifer, Strain CCMP396" /LENGTH=280 /DNA_ID=CAMNT_0020255587 /DNA_START=290 /DNA_END=1132 /DNA_ORIENTATION=-
MPVEGNCSNCGKASNTLRQCKGKCEGYAAYCGKICQREHWQLHRPVCGKKNKPEQAPLFKRYKCPIWPYAGDASSEVPSLKFEQKQPAQRGKPNEDLLGNYAILFATRNCPPDSLFLGESTHGWFHLKPTSDPYCFDGSVNEGSVVQVHTGLIPPFHVFAPTVYGTPPQAKSALRLAPSDNLPEGYTGRFANLVDGWIYIVDEPLAVPYLGREEESLPFLTDADEAKRRNEHFNAVAARNCQDCREPFYIIEKGDLCIELCFGGSTPSKAIIVARKEGRR